MKTSIAADLRAAYRFHRFNAVGARYPRKAGANPASEAIAAARVDVANGTRRYPTSTGWNRAFEGYGSKAMRWIEAPAACGLRFVDYADKLARIDHTGWYIDHFQNETVRGVVYQMPGRDGRPRFIAGYEDPHNGRADSGGPACLDFGEIFEGERGDAWSTSPREDSGARDAAHAADGIAERMAEESREYDRAWNAGRRYGELGEEIAETRRETLAMLAEFKRARVALAGERFETLCSAIRMRVRDALSDIERARNERERLRDGDHSDFPFYPSATLREAFDEGADV